MQLALPAAPTVTMTSLELVDYINQNRPDDAAVLAHSDFLKKVIQVLGGKGNFSSTYIDSQNKERLCYRFPKREACLMAMSYSYDLQAKVFDRMTELEAKTAPAPLDLSNPAALRAALLGYTEQVMQLEAKVSADAPKVAFAEAIRAVDGVCSIEKIAKTIGHGRNKFFKRLREDGVLQENNLPYQKYIDREYFTVIEQEPFTDSKGKSHPTFTTRVTGAGQVFLAKRYAIAMRATDALAVQA